MVMDWPDDAVAEIERLQSRRAEAEDERDRMRRGWQHECESANLMLQGMGLCPSEFRSDGGNLLLGRISHKIGNDRTRLAEAEALIEDIDQREGCEGWGDDLRQRIDAFLTPPSGEPK